MSRALAEVLVKVSGRADVVEEPGIRRVLDKPAGLLQRYRYRPMSVGERQAFQAEQRLNPDLKPAGRPDGDPQMVVFSFDKPAVDKLLTAQGLPVWGATRPSMIAWLAVQDDTGRYLLGAHSNEALSAQVVGAAQRHGLPLLLPLMDLQDQRALRFADVWAGFAEPVLQASSRYRTEAVLIGRLYPDRGGSWQAQWTVLESGVRQTWDTNAPGVDEIINLGISGATGILAARYAPAIGTQQPGLMPVLITGVRNLRDYSRVSAYLASLQQVTQVQVSQVEPERVQFDLVLEGVPEAVVKTIALGDTLRPVQDVTETQRPRFPPDFPNQAPGVGLPPPVGSPPLQVYQLQP